MFRGGKKITFLLFFVISYSLFAQERLSIGKVSFIEGIVDVARNGEEAVFLKEGEPIYGGDRLRTKSYSKAEITFRDKSLLRLAPSTCVQIEEYLFTGENRRQVARIKLSRGKLEAVVSKTSRVDSFVILTPNSQGSVKGSDIFVSFSGARSSFFVREGAVLLFNPAFPEKKVHLAKGQCVSVPLNEAPLPGRAWLNAELLVYRREVEPSFVKKWVPQAGSKQMSIQIVSVSGQVRLYKKGAKDWQPAKTNDILREGDKLQTDSDGKVGLRLENGNTIFLEPQTELSIESLRCDTGSGNYENKFNMPKGRVFGVVKRINPQSTFAVKTPVAICGVRGTFFDFRFVPEEDLTLFAEEVSTSGETAETALQEETLDKKPSFASEGKGSLEAYFEGGGGVITSTLTGQVQEVDAGQGIRVDASGNILEMGYLVPQERLERIEPFTQVQTTRGYFERQGLDAPAGFSPVFEHREGIRAERFLEERPIDFLKEPFQPLLLFPEAFLPPPGVRDTLYESILNLKRAPPDYPTDPAITSAFAHLFIKRDGSWEARIVGNFNQDTSSPWHLCFTRAGSAPFIDQLKFTEIGDPLILNESGTWRAGPGLQFEGQAQSGTDKAKTLILDNLRGEYDGTNNAFIGVATGTWN